MLKKKSTPPQVLQPPPGGPALLTPQSTVIVNDGPWRHRLCIGTPTTGLVRMEWVMARFGQTIPTNWSHVDIMQFLSSYVPIKYQVADAQNLIAREVVEKDFDWLLFIEHDNVLPPNTFVKLNEYMVDGSIPIVGALYFTKSVPPEPMVYKESGKGYFAHWKLGDKIETIMVPFGCSLIHGSIIKAMWKESPEYSVTSNGQTFITRRVFDSPQGTWVSPETGASYSRSGTSDFAWCDKIVRGEYFKKAGWPKFQKKKHPFLIDTSMFVGHIDNNGVVYPLEIPKRFQP